MGSAYGTALNLMDKVKSLSKHRALKYDTSGKLGATLNRFIERVSAELSAYKAVPGQDVIEDEAPSLSEFLSG